MEGKLGHGDESRQKLKRAGNAGTTNAVNVGSMEEWLMAVDYGYRNW